MTGACIETCADCVTLFEKVHQDHLTDLTRKAAEGNSYVPPPLTAAEVIDQQFPECGCEKCSVSPHSPGPISSEEKLIRLVVAPLHIDKKLQTPTVAALVRVHSTGLSVVRHSASNDEIRSTAEKLIADVRQRNKGKMVGLHGVFMIHSSSIINWKTTSGNRVFCLYDTGRSHSPLHAEIFYVGDRSQKVAMATDLLARIKGTFEPVEIFRNGAFADLAPQLVPKAAATE